MRNKQSRDCFILEQLRLLYAMNAGAEKRAAAQADPAEGLGGV